MAQRYILKKFPSWNVFLQMVNQYGDWNDWTLYIDDYREDMFEVDGRLELHIEDPYLGNEDIYGFYYGEELIGLTTMSLVDGLLWIGDFQVNSNMKGQGIGRKMWNAVVEQIDFVRAECIYRDENAKAFWLKMGWKHSHAKVLYYDNNISEALTGGFAPSETTGKAGFSYEIRPLSFNLQLKKQGRHITKKMMKNNQFFVGDSVKGKSLNDKKYHTGIITQLHQDRDSDIDIVFILDDKTSKIEPLKYSTITFYTIDDDDISHVFNYFFTHGNEKISGDIYCGIGE